MGATAPTTPSKCLFFLPEDMRNGILPGTAKLETTRKVVQTPQVQLLLEGVRTSVFLRKRIFIATCDFQVGVSGPPGPSSGSANEQVT